MTHEYGNCYEACARRLLDDPEFKDWLLIHGRPTLQREPFCLFGHAWLESPDRTEVFSPKESRPEKSQEDDMRVPRVLYYALGNINPGFCFAYDKETMRRKLVEHEHWGPWDGPYQHFAEFDFAELERAFANQQIDEDEAHGRIRRFINAAESPEERQRRKSLSFGFLYYTS